MPFGADPLAVLVGAAAFFLAGLVKGGIGLGLPPVAMGLLTLVLAPVQAAALLVVPSLATNVWQLLAGPTLGALARRLWPTLAGIAAGTLAGTGSMAGDATGGAAVAVGVALAAYAALGLAALDLAVPPAAERWLGPLVGLATGLVTAATGLAAVPLVPYLGALRLGRDELIQALGLSFTVSTLALAASLALAGSFPAGIAGASLAALAPTALGMAAGGWLRGRVGQLLFRRCFFVGLLALGLHLALRPLL